METRREFLMRASVAAAVATESAGATQVNVADNFLRPQTSMKPSRVPRTDLVVSSIAYGCAELAGWSGVPLNAIAVGKAERAIRSAFDSGITFFDHSDSYGWGRAEEVFGEVLKRAPGLRNGIVIQSKSGMVYPMQDGAWQFDCRYKHIVESVHTSLRRLGTDHLDILLLHWSDALVEPEEVAKSFDELKRSGKVRYFGVSNHFVGQIELLKTVVEQPLVINQIQLGVGFPNAILEGFVNSYFTSRSISVTGILDYCRLHEIQVQAYAPLRGGVLNPPQDAPPEVREVAQLLAEIARRQNTTPSAVALAWLLRHPAGIVPIIGSTNPDHIAENCAAHRIQLNRDDWYALLRAAAKIKQPD